MNLLNDIVRVLNLMLAFAEKRLSRVSEEFPKKKNRHDNLYNIFDLNSRCVCSIQIRTLNSMFLLNVVQ